ncbi:hypothetical protein BC937DRAFT_87119 [Endogone sp. FLAS-F59071]|nr:hypothetical protein BC937DRAFT_87119 [Endogone sp. FLAS-F59071]|eukprot:RUS19676.1 hypothetical protein BC937DRAFT_87119 [Endogone sp. FLAS-F59071]
MVWPVGPMTSAGPNLRISGTRSFVSGDMASLDATARTPVSILFACGSIWDRTTELAPSAATRRFPLALVPSWKKAVTVLPSSDNSYRRKRLSNRT